ncbi:MAG TPA: efflux RND transporter periplasmic adaptor subunit [Tepidisphaeraceae bacterium]|jgi:multidrug efflux system membrane fusion protein|nr:efflux RND transporter periplasmic adaptor subunit [Tepidisphaeraceae bacterium]
MKFFFSVNRLKPGRRTAAGVGLALLGMGMSAGCHRKDAQTAMAGGMPPAQVVVANAVAADVPVYLDEIGKTSARELVTLMPQVGGQIKERQFTDGAELKQGQLLFTIDPRPFEAALHQAQAMLAKDKAAAANATAFAARQEKVFKEQSISAQDYDQARFTAEAAAATVKADEAAIETAQLNLEYCSIKSPIDGRAGQRLVDPGNIVTSNTTALLVIQRLDPIYVDFTVNESDLAAVRENMATGTLTTLVKLPTEAIEGRAGELTFLDNAVQDASGAIKLRATIKNDDRRFWPGQFVNVRLVLKIRKGAVLVPNAAVQLGQKGSFVYVVNRDDTAALAPVKVGQSQGDKVVVDGVNAGDRVIVDGQILVFPGGKVHVVPGQTPVAGASPTTQVAADEGGKKQ